MYYKNRKDYYIYKHTSPNNKIYIGYSCQQKPEYRWRNGKGYIKNPLMWNAIQKYGWENFKHEILETGLSFNDANLKEIYYIKLYKSDKRNFGYNLTTGGSNPNQTKEAREKNRNAHIGKRFYRSMIYQYDNNGNLLNIFKSYREAEETTGINLYRVASSCNKKGIAGLFCFSKIPLSKEEIENRVHKSIFKKYVYQYDLKTGKFINKFNSNKEASELTGLSEDTICMSCSNNLNKDMGKAFPGGYLFRHDKLSNDDLLKFINQYKTRENEKILRRKAYYEKCKNKNIKP